MFVAALHIDRPERIPAGIVLHWYPRKRGPVEKWFRVSGNGLLFQRADVRPGLHVFATAATLMQEGDLWEGERLHGPHYAFEEEMELQKTLAERPFDLTITDEGRDMLTRWPHTGSEGGGDNDLIPLAVVAEAYGIKRKPMKRRIDAYFLPHVVTSRGTCIPREVALDLAAHVGAGISDD